MGVRGALLLSGAVSLTEPLGYDALTCVLLRSFYILQKVEKRQL